MTSRPVTGREEAALWKLLLGCAIVTDSGQRSALTRAITAWLEAARQQGIAEGREEREKEMMRAYHVTLDGLGAPADQWPCVRVGKLFRAAEARERSAVAQARRDALGEAASWFAEWKDSALDARDVTRWLRTRALAAPAEPSHPGGK